MKKVTLLLALGAVAQAHAETPEDPYIWLEEVESNEALAWVEEQNTTSLGYLEALPTFDPFVARNLEIYDSDERIPSPGIRGDLIYNFWRDENNKRGVWRRTTLDSYVSGNPDWDVVLDLDALAEVEDEDWVWKGANCMRPEYRLCMLNLSRGGADAVVMREFDADEKTFVEDGFFVPEAKSSFSWIDEDTAYLGSDFGDGALTDSGYPRTSRLWHRGEPIAEATEIFAGEQQDVGAYVYRIWDGATHYDIAHQVPSFFTAVINLYNDDGDIVKLDIPLDAAFHGVVQGQMVLELKSDWSIEGADYPQGALLAINFDDFLDGGRNFDVILVPDETSAIVRGGVMRTRDYIIVNQIEHVVSKVTRFEYVDGRWQGVDLPSHGIGRVSFATASDDSNLFFYYYESFLQPDTLYAANDGGETRDAVQSLPAFFDTDGMSIEQHFAVSADGTEVPYFLVLPKDFVSDGETPTLMYGYGGFQITSAPSYSATVGHSWLAQGGAYVVAGIRGGGEYGPRWHRAAMLENRQRAYDDFIAIGEDLVARNITSPEHLGIRGGSNGGLLTGVMLTQRPDLFKGVVIQVPLLDMQRFHLLLAGASWMAEYGNPDTDDWEFISKYSPYQNLDAATDYPTPLITTSTRDDRVHPAHARKMVARMNEMGHDLYYYENTVGGHAGASDNSQAARVQAMIYSYLWDQLGGAE
ncbi:MAG: prolyl oligopeptidase family serine peptidase [Pseudomonadota bacterium]